MTKLTHISLFTGIGGIDLAAEWAGFETVLMVENNAYCQKVLNKHWPDVPMESDIYETHPKGTATLITGGFPCQPFSVAGKQRGKGDDRYLWPEMLRVIKEVRPGWVVAENVAGLIRMGLDDCLSDLEREGYITETFLIPACAVNAPHIRDRIFIVGYAKHNGQYVADSDNKRIRTPRNESERERETRTNEGRDRPQSESSRQGQDVADPLFRTTGSPHRKGSDGGGADGEQDNRDGLGNDSGNSGSSRGDWWSVEPDVGRVAHGISNRVHRLKALGNAVVPQQIYPVLKAIADIEKDAQ